MTNTSSISKFLYITYDEYLDQYLIGYMRWCEKWSNEFGIQLQSLMANTAICNWYNNWHEELEWKAYETLKPTFGKISRTMANTIYKTIMIELYTNYPKPLFDVAKKVNIIGNLN